MNLILSNGQLDICAANKCGVYGLQFPDGGWLVGYSNSILVRLSRYISGEKINKRTKEAVSLHGWKPILGYVLEECPNDIDVLKRREEHWSKYLHSFEDGYNAVPCGYGCAESGRLAPRPEYDNRFKQSVSVGMKQHHANKPPVGGTKKYKNWKRLWAAATSIKPNLDPTKNLGRCPTTEFEIEFDKLSDWNKKRVMKLIKI